MNLNHNTLLVYALIPTMSHQFDQSQKKTYSQILFLEAHVDPPDKKKLLPLYLSKFLLEFCWFNNSLFSMWFKPENARDFFFIVSYPVSTLTHR